MNHKKSNLIVAGLFLIGILILLYPFFSDLWNRRRADRLISDYAETAGRIDTEDDEAETEKVKVFNQRLIGKTVPDVFRLDEGERDAEYERLLNLNHDGIMAYVIIPKINVHLPIYHYTTDEVLEKGAGHLFGSSLPLGGPSTHSVITAHRGLPSAKYFTDLNMLEKGDIVLINVLTKQLAYEVDQIQVVEPTETRSLSISEGQDYLTLMTCTPYSVNSHRLLVRAHRIPNDAKLQDEIKAIKPVANTENLRNQLFYAAGGVMTAAFLVFLCASLKKAIIKRQSGDEK